MKSIFIYLIISITYTWSASGQGLLNGDFEYWGVSSITFAEVPEDWNTTSDKREGVLSITKTSDAYAGNFALKMENILASPGGLMVAHAAAKNKIEGRPESLTGFYKVELQGDDVSGMTIFFTSVEGVVGWGNLVLDKSTNQYTSFEVPIEYLSPTSIPDSFFINIFTSLSTATRGTTLTIDEMKFRYSSDDYSPAFPEQKTILRPNPVTDELLVEVPEKIGKVTFRIFDSNGRNLENESFILQTRIDVSEFTPGIYFYEVRLNGHSLYDSGRFMVSRHTE